MHLVHSYLFTLLSFVNFLLYIFATSDQDRKGLKFTVKSMYILVLIYITLKCTLVPVLALGRKAFYVKINSQKVIQFTIYGLRANHNTWL